jgi:glycosyltransferase involved in cell wall biosynthesis
MNVLLLSAFDTEGGASRSTYRLHQGLHKIGIHSKMLVQEKFSNDTTVIAPKTRLEQGIAKARLTFDAYPLKQYTSRSETSFSPQWLPDTTLNRISQISPDLVNLHWINAAFMRIETISKLKRPLVWTLHDMWAFSGGCHYNETCDRYTSSCGSCPQLGSQKDTDLSHWVWKRKLRAWQTLDLTVVTPSKWLSQCVKASSLLKKTRVEVIPYGLDTDIYRPINQSTARELLNLPQDKHLVLFGALQATGDKRKGFHLLQPALVDLSRNGWGDKIELVVLGASRSNTSPEFGFKSHYLGTLKDDLSISLVYAAADVFVAPSVQDNLPNTVLEAIACGTPCVAFNTGGIPDMIEHQRNGYLAEPFRISDLAQGIVWVLEDEERYARLAHRSREKAEQEFVLTLQAKRYESLFTQILASKDKGF